MASHPDEATSDDPAPKTPPLRADIHWRRVPALAPECRLLVHDISKDLNLGVMLRTAACFGVSEVAVVGRKPGRIRGDMGAKDSLRFTRYTTLRDAIVTLQRDGFRVLAVEITPGARSVCGEPFEGPTAFLLGNEAGGVDPAALALCDGHVYVPQHGEGQASLNVGVACAIVLHRFAAWAGYPELPRDASGYKFQVDWKTPRDGV